MARYRLFAQNKLNMNTTKDCVIIGISMMMRVIMGILASRLSAPYIDTNINLAGDIYHALDITGQAMIPLAIGIVFWKRYIAPAAFCITVLQLGKVASILFKDLPIYNFNEAFFFVNICTWLIYTTFSWKFKNFTGWYIPLLISHLILGYLFLLIKPYI